MTLASPAPLLITVHASTASDEGGWAEALRGILRELTHLKVVERSLASTSGDIVFVDARHRHLGRELEAIPREGRSVFLLYQEGDPLPAAFAEGKVDDLLIAPIRSLELLSKIRLHEQFRLWEQVSRMNTSLETVITRLKGDLAVSERLQKARLPIRFPEIRGFQVTSRYLAGLKSGGDYFDLAESRDGKQLAMLLTDSSSYGLSSAVVSSIVRVASRLSVEQSRSVRELVRSFYEELLVPLGPQDRLSLFYGVLSRKDFQLRYLNLGNSRAFLQRSHGALEALSVHGGPLSQGSRHSLGTPSALQESSVVLEPSDRVVLLSDGYLELLGGEAGARALLEGFARKPAVDMVNELAFQARSRLENPREQLPEQDCSALVFDVDSKLIKLVSPS
ncbi:MAG: sigmaB regulation protein RsbU [Pseudomonadota bacterium]|jgi:sigma-B regulation protein RsbU (phosphoserine phosphatase)